MDNSAKKSNKIGCLVALLIFGLVISTVTYFVLFHIKTTDIYRCAVSEAKKNPQIIENIGEPIETGFFVWLDEYSAGRFSEEAHFNVSLTGTKGAGRLYVRAFKDIQSSSMTLIFEKEEGREIVQSGDYPCQ